MTLYIGVDFHPHQQMVAWCDKETGETQTLATWFGRIYEEVTRIYFVVETEDSLNEQPAKFSEKMGKY